MIDNNETIKPLRIGNHYIAQNMIDYVKNLPDPLKDVLLMGPVVSLIAENKPTVITKKRSWLEKIMGISDRIVVNKEPDLSGSDYRAVQELVMMGLYQETSSVWRYNIDVGPDDEDRFEVESIKPHASGFAIQKTWRLTEKGEVMFELLKSTHLD